MSFNNNQSVDVNTQGIPTVNQAVINCTNAASDGKLITTESPLIFENPKVETGRSEVCEFGKNDNIAMAQDILTARYEQSVSIPLPANAVLCGAEFSSTASTFAYDDMFYLMLNDYVIASSLKKSLSKLQSEPVTSNNGTDNAYKYDWLSLRSSSFAMVNESSDNYCFGSSLGSGDCYWPNSQKSGPFSLKFDPSLIIALGLKVPSSAQTIRFVVTGDNNPATDCVHERLEMKLKYTYYLRQ